MAEKIKLQSDKQLQEQSGVVVGILLGLAKDGSPLVAYTGGPTGQVKARSTVGLSTADIGAQVALLFEAGDFSKPLVIGRILVPGAKKRDEPSTVSVKIDNEVLTLAADREIVLKCGKASITLTRAGKILIRGAYVSSRSSGVNKIKGGSIQLN